MQRHRYFSSDIYNPPNACCHPLKTYRLLRIKASRTSYKKIERVLRCWSILSQMRRGWISRMSHEIDLTQRLFPSTISLRLYGPSITSLRRSCQLRSRGFFWPSSNTYHRCGRWSIEQGIQPEMDASMAFCLNHHLWPWLVYWADYRLPLFSASSSSCRYGIIFFDRDWSIDLAVSKLPFPTLCAVSVQSSPGLRVASFFSRCQCDPVVARLDECSTDIGLTFLGSWQEEKTGELVKIKPRTFERNSRSVWFFNWTRLLVKCNAEEWRSAVCCVEQGATPTDKMAKRSWMQALLS